MAKQIIWTKRAIKDRVTILDYWNERNKSKNYSIKLNELFKESINIISNYPLIGKLSDLDNVRVKIIKDYLIIYEITNKNIIVLTIWDCRKNPLDLQRILK